MKTPLLGGLTPTRFLREYWHKKPLLIRNAVPGFAGLLTPAEMQALARRDDVESRLVQGRGRRWRLDHGPFRAADFKRLPKTHWTLLVQSLNHHLPEADALLRRFDFVPHARLDDLMVSYAAPGGSVGPHFDSYDVFLLQGPGRRRWQIGAQTDLTCLADAPLRILRRFEPETEWVLEAGDMLYLPPQIAHHGVAVDACTTYSIGFRAPTAEELTHAFLMHLQDTVTLDGRYADPGLHPQRHPGKIGRAMLVQIERMIGRIKWDRQTVADFAGLYLSEPKPSVFFDPPETPLTPAAFKRQAGRQGVRLDRRSRLLFIGMRFYINGEALDASPEESAALQRLADTRELPAPSAPLPGCLYDWYAAGWLEIAAP